ncbi:hypothetical protein VT84_19920 [Gemmata sp. SH-PL17]|uniref:hypothetical protein n=1 Tax=Gemmata sp. SH-PL17 TaxID=1630693 RepID=UPI0004AE4977|nr:hypothetical protein [Gemmata sp. SH-PL17]AMV26677.1 hypothetical protein VT84_19920 [Gemmata sp. SH-PL17]
MNHSTKKQHHEQARKKHKHEIQEHAREASRRGRSKLPIALLASGLIVLLVVVLVVSLM